VTTAKPSEVFKKFTRFILDQVLVDSSAVVHVQSHKRDTSSATSTLEGANGRGICPVGGSFLGHDFLAKLLLLVDPFLRLVLQAANMQPLPVPSIPARGSYFTIAICASVLESERS
jgi:hypothetical protein